MIVHLRGAGPDCDAGRDTGDDPGEAAATQLLVRSASNQSLNGSSVESASFLGGRFLGGRFLGGRFLLIDF